MTITAEAQRAHFKAEAKASVCDATSRNCPDPNCAVHVVPHAVVDNRGNLCVECGEVIGGLSPSTFRPEYCRRCAADSLCEQDTYGPDD